MKRDIKVKRDIKENATRSRESSPRAKSLAVALLAGAGLIFGAQSAMAQQAYDASQSGLTRAQVKADLIRWEQAGYDPVANDPEYPNDVLAAKARLDGQAGAAARPNPTWGRGRVAQPNW